MTELDGLYIHRDGDPSKHGIGGTRTMTISTQGVVCEWVHTDDFMIMQRERDNLRRALALINAWRHSGRNDRAELDRQLSIAGFDRDDGIAMLSLIADVRSWKSVDDGSG